MVKYARPKVEDIDLGEFAPDRSDPKALYGLPQTVQFCRKCVISNQRPSSSVEFKHSKASQKSTIGFDAEGVCDACRIAEHKQAEVDWDDRERQLQELCDRFRRTDGRYDCILPGSGGKDSFYAAYKLKYEYGMHPLTVTWAPHLSTDWGWRNHQAWIHTGFDNHLVTPNGLVHRLLTRLAVENLFHPFQPFILGQKNLAPRMANLFDIPLVFYGENEAEYGNPAADFESAQRSHTYFAHNDPSDIYLGGETLDVLQRECGLTWNDIHPYLPADAEELDRRGVEVHYLGYYLNWHPQTCYYYAVEKGGFQASPERTPGTYSKYNSIDDKIDDFHYYTTWTKFGIGRATYDAAQEVRSGDLDRDEAVALVRRYDGEYPVRFEDEIFQYLSLPSESFPQASRLFEVPQMDRDYFMALANRFRSPHLWQYDADRGWTLRHRL